MSVAADGSTEANLYCLPPAENAKMGRSKTAQKVRKIPVFVVNTGYFYGCGGRTRTYDLRVMSPTSFQLLYSAIFRCTLDCLGIIAYAVVFVNPILWISELYFLSETQD